MPCDITATVGKLVRISFLTMSTFRDGITIVENPAQRSYKI